MDCFHQQNDIALVCRAEYRSQIMQKKLQCPFSSLAVVHIILIERTGIQLPSVDQRPRLVIQDEEEE